MDSDRRPAPSTSHPSSVDRRIAYGFLASFSLFYFLSVILLAREKLFDYDELFSLYVGRLPLSRLFQELLAGIERHPPLTYLSVHFSLLLPGDPLVTVRLGMMIGFWLCCITIFGVVYRRCGFVWAALAAMLPCFTVLYDQAYYARGYALLLGCLATAFLAWQRAASSPNRRAAWLILLALSLGLATWVHYYALINASPLLLAELFRWRTNRKVDWGIAAAWVFCVGAMAALAPMAAAARRTYGTPWQGWSWQSGFATYEAIFSPVLLPIAVCLIVAGAFTLIVPTSSKITESQLLSPPRYELLAALGFLLVPFIGLLATASIHTGYVDRYFSGVVLGGALLPPLLAPGFWMRRERLGMLFVTLLFLGFAIQAARPLKRQYLRGGIPRSPYGLDFSFVSQGPPGEDIVWTDTLSFLSAEYYAPRDLAARLCFLTWPEERLRRLGEDAMDRDMMGIGRIATYRLADYREYIASHPRFLLFSDVHYTAGRASWQMTRLLEDGFRLETIAVANGAELIQAHRP